MRTLYSLLMAVAFVSMGMLAQAYPNLNASSGLLAVPTAEIVAPGNVVAAVDIVAHDDTSINGRVIVGVTPFLEIGAGVIAGEDTGVGLSAKLALPSTVLGFKPALGVSFINGDVGDGTQVFLVGTRSFSSQDMDTGRLTGTIGINFTDIKSASAVRPFVGAQLRVGSRTEIDGEFVLKTGDFSRSIHSLFIRHAIDDTWKLQTGFTNAVGFTGSSDTNFFVGTAYTWGAGR